MAGGKSSRQKGDREERRLVNHFRDHGINASRIPMSGASAFEGFSGFDLTVPMFGKTYKAEVKHYGNGFQTLYKWLAHGKNDFLIVRADHSEALAVIPLPILINMIKHRDGE
jgi:hypothetical protein